MPRKEIRGTGITAYETTVYDIQKESPKGWGDGWNRAIKDGGGIFGAVSLQALRTCEHIMANAKDGPVLVDSPEDFARKIAKYIRVAKARIRDGSADLAARHAFDAGVEWARATMKWTWENDALRGEKVAGGERNAAHARNSRHQPRREERAARMAVLAPTIGVDKAATQCEIEGLGKADAIKRQWNRNRKKRDT